MTRKSSETTTGIAIVGGGICGLKLALDLHQRGIACDVYERASQIKELGVGITVLPHGMREFAALGLADKLVAQGIENQESCFFNRFGQLIYKEARGKLAGHAFRRSACIAAASTRRSTMPPASGSAPTASSPIATVSASSRTRRARRSVSARPRRDAPSRRCAPPP